MPERNDWYYWTKRKNGHFIVFRDRDNQVATARITPLSDGTFNYQVNGPCWSTFEEKGNLPTLDETKQLIDSRVMAIIKQEFRPELPYTR